MTAHDKAAGSYRVTLLFAYYDPEITAVTYLHKSLAEDLARQGMRVTVITGFPTRGVDAAARRAHRRKKREVRENGRLTIRRVAGLGREPRSFILRVFWYIWLSIALFGAALPVKADALYVDSTPPTLALAGLWLKRFKRIPSLYHVQDIFPDSLFGAGKGRREGIFERMGERMARALYRHHSKILVISDDFRKKLLQKGVLEDKINIIYNWVDEAAVTPIPRDRNILPARYGLDPSRFYATYCGNIGLTQTLTMLVDVAVSLAGEPGLGFVIVGDGVDKERLMRYAAERGARNVTFLPYQPYEELSHVMSLGNVGLILSRAGVGQHSFPSKTWSILSAARPVIVSFDPESELCAMVERAGCGWCVPPQNPAELKGAILTAMRSPDLSAMGEKGRRFVETHLARRDATGRIFALLTALIEGRS